MRTPSETARQPIHHTSARHQLLFALPLLGVALFLTVQTIALLLL